MHSLLLHFNINIVNVVVGSLKDHKSRNSRLVLALGNGKDLQGCCKLMGLDDVFDIETVQF